MQKLRQNCKQLERITSRGKTTSSACCYICKDKPTNIYMNVCVCIHIHTHTYYDFKNPSILLKKIEFLIWIWSWRKRKWIYIFVCVFISRSWCPDRTLSQARKYIASSLHERYTEPVILNLRKTWEESDMRTPLICFLSMGSDPTDQINSLSRKLNLGKKVIIHCHVLRHRGAV